MAAITGLVIVETVMCTKYLDTGEISKERKTFNALYINLIVGLLAVMNTEPPLQNFEANKQPMLDYPKPEDPCRLNLLIITCHQWHTLNAVTIFFMRMNFT